MKNRTHDKFVRCKFCGSVGGQLVKVTEASDKKPAEYACANITTCNFKRSHRDICNTYECMEKAEGKCSCGMQLCRTHGVEHMRAGHVGIKPLK